MRAFARNIIHKLEHSHHSHRHHHHHDDDDDQPEQARMVFAHYMVGLTDGQTASDWTSEILTAREAGIDGFALNIGPSDPWTHAQLRLAYDAAAGLSDFVLFPSFDMACGGEWSVGAVVDIVDAFCKAYAPRVQHTVGGLPFVSTFEGPGWAHNWDAVRRATGGVFLVPDWSSLGPEEVGRRLGVVDGAFSWAAWPRAGESRITAEEDVLYKKALRGKAYMMGVSPWFYTRLPQWHKNWYSSSETLWFDRWAQILQEKPDYVQIITWNDFGESSYICDPRRPSQVVPGAEKYVDGHSHSAFRVMLPHFIKAYKAGVSMRSLEPEEHCAIAWYRTTPARCGPDGDTVWGQGGSQSASHGARDVISVCVVNAEPTTVVLGIGDYFEQLNTHHSVHGKVSFFTIDIGNRTGSVTLQMHGKSAEGPAIRSDCSSCGHVLYNCAAIGVRHRPGD